MQEKVSNLHLNESDRAGALVSFIEDIVNVRAFYFVKFVHILESEEFLMEMASELVECYCKLAKMQGTCRS